ncbi:MAG TPA: patatin-like phospholipase family protein [Beijerinckiaceae bacterium]|jgi:NTE family protein
MDIRTDIDSLQSTPGTRPPATTAGPRHKRKPARRRLSLALQGGGSFGAFTWGILDRLLDEEDLAFDAVSGASAGALNAVVLASGLKRGGNPGAKESLHRFWEAVSEAPPKSGSGMAVDLATRVVSPYQFNPFNLNPLRGILAEEVDFAALKAAPSLRLLIAATRVSDGKLRIFREKELSLDVALASSCLPLLHHAVTIDGEAYWDGGYSANPPLMPLVAASRASDVLVVQIVPTAGAEMPTTSPEIVKRTLQITFNGPLLRDLEALAAMTKLSGAEGEGSPLSRKLKRLRLHHVTAEKEIPGLGEASALDRDWDFLVALRDAGRAAASRWLAAEAARRAAQETGS